MTDQTDPSGIVTEETILNEGLTNLLKEVFGDPSEANCDMLFSIDCDDNNEIDIAINFSADPKKVAKALKMLQKNMSTIIVSYLGNEYIHDKEKHGFIEEFAKSWKSRGRKMPVIRASRVI